MKDRFINDQDNLLHLGIVEKNKGEYWDNINAGFKDAGNHFGISIEFVAPEYENIDEQISLLEDQIGKKPDGLAFVASDKTAFNHVVQKAIRLRIPVVTFDLDAPGSGRYLYVGTKPPTELGRQAGQLMVASAKKVGPIAVQTGSHTAQGAIGKLAGFREAVEGHGFEIINVMNDGEQLSEAYSNARSYLEDNPDLVGLFGVYGYHPYLQAKALQDVGSRQELAIVGFDMLPETIKYIEKGVINASIWIQEYYFGYFAATAIYNIIRIGVDRALRFLDMDTQNYENNSIILPTKVWSLDNIQSFNEQNPIN